MTQKNISTKDRLIFALDVPDCEVAKNLVQELGDSVNFYKLGIELMMTGDYFDLLDWMLSKEKKVFADLKFFDIPATVGAAVYRLKNRGLVLLPCMAINPLWKLLLRIRVIILKYLR